MGRWTSNCDSCSVWRMLVWADGGFEHDKGDARQSDDPSTVAGKYYGGHEPCEYGNNYPLCGDWISTVTTEESTTKATSLTTALLLETTASDTVSVPQDCADKLPSNYDNIACGWTCADWAGKGNYNKNTSSTDGYYCEDDWSQYLHCGPNIKGLIKDYCKISCNNCDLEDNYDEIPKNDVKQHPDWLESLVTELPTSTEALGKESQELNMVSSQGRKDSSCVDQKVWCKFADCSLENVRRKCQKTCNNCL